MDSCWYLRRLRGEPGGDTATGMVSGNAGQGMPSVAVIHVDRHPPDNLAPTKVAARTAQENPDNLVTVAHEKAAVKVVQEKAVIRVVRERAVIRVVRERAADHPVTHPVPVKLPATPEARP